MSAHWNGYGYPEQNPKVWISFGSRDGKTLVWITELKSYLGTDEPEDIDVYIATLIPKTEERSAQEYANSRADSIIIERGL